MNILLCEDLNRWIGGNFKELNIIVYLCCFGDFWSSCGNLQPQFYVSCCMYDQMAFPPLKNLSEDTLSSFLRISCCFWLTFPHHSSKFIIVDPAILQENPSYDNEVRTALSSGYCKDVKGVGSVEFVEHTCPERRNTTEKDVQHNPNTPDIDFWSISSLQDFWSNIARNLLPSEAHPHPYSIARNSQA
ncbi:hypothetical protein ACJIZ3_017494 [Penstemon smallii]|uniref:Uncharacterized protein n=1 Tax=Penstemon smallii TaxID=265156 RepID=A0ABD3SVP7_9LAMI